ncbi:MAG: helix-turn-helix transcriptional regulator [Salinivirgaceae bacterium]|nr:helix-turn-helix transcriptional regulator [Salinivirgaceae bacterium]
MLRIKELLKAKQLTSKELAAKIGVTEGAISQQIKPESKPTLSTLEKIADALGVSVIDLIDAPAKDSIICPHCGKQIKIKIDIK